MIYRKSSPNPSQVTAVSYEFLAPTRLTMRYPDGQEWLIGYGIGERVRVMEPSVQHLVCLHDILDEIPLDDGRTIINWPDDLCVRHVW